MALLWTTTLINTAVIITFGTAIWPGHSTNMWSLFGRRPALNLWKYNVILRNQCAMNKDQHSPKLNSKFSFLYKTAVWFSIELNEERMIVVIKYILKHFIKCKFNISCIPIFLIYISMKSEISLFRDLYFSD